MMKSRRKIFIGILVIAGAAVIAGGILYALWRSSALLKRDKAVEGTAQPVQYEA